MKQAMITVCGDFDYWVSDIMLTCLAKLSNALGQNNYEVAYADSMSNAQMANPVKSVELEAGLSRKANADILFVIYRDTERKNNLYTIFNQLRELLPRKTALVLIDIGNIDALIREQKILLSQLEGLYFLHGTRGIDKETVKILLRDIALGV